jgi:hypothetical protein
MYYLYVVSKESFECKKTFKIKFNKYKLNANKKEKTIRREKPTK